MRHEKTARVGNPGRLQNKLGYTLTIPEIDAYAAHVNGGFVVVVETHPGRYRRRVFLSLASAERHVRKARERDQSVRIVLATLTPLYIVSGTAQSELSDAGGGRRG